MEMDDKVVLLANRFELDVLMAFYESRLTFARDIDLRKKIAKRLADLAYSHDEAVAKAEKCAEKTEAKTE